MENNLDKKVLILSCGTGGGHNSAAKAIQENLTSKGIKADFIEYLDIINSKLKDKINNMYINSTHGNGNIFKTVYHLGEWYQKTNLKSPVYELNSLNRKKLYKYIIDNKYDYVITTHLFAAQALTAIKRKYPIHFMAVATDYVCIPFWEEVEPDFFIIPNRELVENFSNRGICKEKILPLGIPVSKQYCINYDKEKYKKILNLDVKKKYVLILTGSMGFGNIDKMLEKLVEQIKDITFIVACGNNKNMLDTITDKYKNDNQVIPLPFTSNLAEYMSCSEIVLSKPGGLTSTEIATLRKPFIHTMPIPGCENYNADFFSKREMSLKCNTLQDVVENTKKLLNNLELQNIMIENQAKYINKNACDEISKEIIKEISKS